MTPRRYPGWHSMDPDPSSPVSLGYLPVHARMTLDPDPLHVPEPEFAAPAPSDHPPLWALAALFLAGLAAIAIVALWLKS